MGEAYPIPAEALDDRLAFVGTAGSGKTYAAGTAVERLLTSGARCVIVDPLDVWWGLRLTPDGEKASRFNIVVFGGAHGDLPLNEHAGALLGETVAIMAESCIVSLGGMQTKSAERRFMLAFLDAIYRKADPTKGGRFHVVFDEADLWAPQKASEPMLQSRMEEIVRRGRVRGFIPWLITQRPAVLSKDVLSQADGLIALKLTASQDRDAIGAWIEGMADRAQGREILGSLPAMQRGQGVIWIPGRGVLQTSTFPLKATYDSSRTPKRGEVVRGATLKPLDLGKLKERLASVEAETKANDPKVLKAEIARLTRELAAKPATAVAQGPTADEIAHLEDLAFMRGVEEGERRGNPAGQALMLTRVRNVIDGLKVEEAPQKAQEAPRAAAAPVQRLSPAPPPAPVATPNGAAPGAPVLSGPMRRIINAVAWWGAAGIPEPSTEQVAFVAGYGNATGGGFTNPRSALSAAGLVEYPRAGHIRLTDAGAALAEAPTETLTTEVLHGRVMERLNGPQQRILRPLLEAYPEAMDSPQLAELAGYTNHTGGGFTNPRSSLSSISLITYPAQGLVRAADWLFP